MFGDEVLMKLASCPDAHPAARDAAG